MAGPVGSFYLDLGVNIPQGSLKKVDAFFASIERRMAKAAKGLNIKPVLSVEFNVSKAAITRLRSAINSVSKSTTLKIGTELTAPTKKQVSAINKGLLASAKSNPIRLPVTIDARWVDAKLAGLTRRKSLLSTSGRLSDTVNNALAKMPVVPIMARVNALVLQQSVTTALRGLGSRGFTISPQVSSAAISAMRDQLRIGLSNIFINPVLSQNYLNQVKQVQKAQQATQRSSQQERPQLADKSGRNFMYGGGTAGALARYGVGSVPFIGGAYGLMTLNRGSQELQANAMALSASAGNEADAEKYAEFLNSLGDRLGKKTSTMTPFFSQMLAGSKGTALEHHLMAGFESLMEYSSVMMLDDQKIKGTIRAFTQMIGKQQIMAEELRGQAAEHLPPIVRLMADVAAGGDTKKLNKMMELGQLDPNVHLPLLFARLKEEAEPLLPKYFKTSVFAQGFMGKKFEDLLKTFGEKGGDEGFARFFKSIADSASKLNPVVEGLAKSFNWLTKQIEGPILLIGDMGRVFTDATSKLVDFKTQIDEINPSIAQLAGLGALMLTKWGRVGAMFSMIYLVMEDIVGWANGRDSAIGLVMDKMQEFVAFDKDIMAMSMSVLTLAAAFKILSSSMSLIPDIFNRRGKKGKTPDIDLPDAGGKGKTKFGRLGGLGPTAAAAGLAAFWGMNEQEFSDRMRQNFSLKEESSVILERLFGGGLGAIGRTLGTGGNIPWHQRDEYLSGLGRQWESPSEFLDFKKQQALYGEGNGQSDIPSVPNTPEQAQKFDQTVAAIQQMQSLGYLEDKIKSALGSTSFNLPYDFEYAGNVYNPSNVQQAVQDASTVNNNSNTTITNQFDIKIDGVIDPAGLESVFEEQVMPRVESWWTNELGNVNMSFGSK